MTNSIIQDKKRRNLIQRYEMLRKQLKSIFYNRSLPEEVRNEAFIKLNSLPRNSSQIRSKNRCVLTGRGRSVYQDFKLSRITLRELASNGNIPGIRKASW